MTQILSCPDPSCMFPPMVNLQITLSTTIQIPPVSGIRPVPSRGPGGLLLFTQVVHYRSLAPQWPQDNVPRFWTRALEAWEAWEVCFPVPFVIPIRTPPLASYRHPGFAARTPKSKI
jgi:hypothetical protein